MSCTQARSARTLQSAPGMRLTVLKEKHRITGSLLLEAFPKHGPERLARPYCLTGENMADLTPHEVKSLGLAVGLELEEPLLTEVTYNLNALRDLLEDVNPPGLDEVEPLPIILPHERSQHEQG